MAMATRNGHIKLFGRDNTQALLQSDAAVPSKFLQFMDNQGILLNVTTENHIEVWDIDAKRLCYVHIFNEEITSFTVLQQSSYIYVGDHLGNISVLMLDYKQQHLVEMQYRIPFSESYGTTAEVGNETAVIYIMPQPMVESRRVLIIFRDGLISLWDIQESKAVFVSGRSAPHSSHHEPKHVVSACWACTQGSKVVVGYSNGDLFLWAILFNSNQKYAPAKNKHEINAVPNIPLLKLNLGFKMDKIPIVSLRWVAGDGKTSRIYINGFFDDDTYLFQVLILNETTESRTIKLVLPLTEACLSMELISCFNDQNKHQPNALVLLLKSGCLCLVDDSQIERYLIQCQSKSPPTLPSQILVKLPFGDSPITVAKLYTSNTAPLSFMDEDNILLTNKYAYLLSTNPKEKDKNCLSSARFSELSKMRGLYITGHTDGDINLWDASCPLLQLVISIKPQNEDNNSSSSGAPITSLHFDTSLQVLVSGDQNGLVQIITFKKEQLASQNIFSFLQAKPGDNYTVHSVKLKGAILSTSVNTDIKHLAVGTDKGLVSVINMEDASIIYQKQMQSQLYSGVTSLRFEKYCQDGSEKNVLLVGMEDSVVWAFEEDKGDAMSTNSIRTKEPSRALLMEILDAPTETGWVSNSLDISKENSFKETASNHSILLLCSENAVRLYSSSHAIQGIKKLIHKKQLSGSCYYASVLYGPSSSIGLILVFASGKIEIRSLPDLTLLKEASLRGFTFLRQKSKLHRAAILSSSSDGELVMVNGDQEILFFSTLCRKDIYRNLELINLVFRRDIALEEESSYMMNTPKEKKKGIFATVVKDLKGNKSKQNQEIDVEDFSPSTSEELSAIFSKANFPPDSGRRNSSTKDGEDVELSIDDINIEDGQPKHKGPNFAVLSKQKFGKGLQALKGKLKPKTEEKAHLGKEKPEDAIPISAVDQIKMKYGYSANNESSIPEMAKNKLKENVRKLEAIGMRTSQMENNAQSFSSMAKELLSIVKNEKSS
ncbi:uncharacterized protein LOC109707188 isoform X3 [Ananas comosus]|uniref:Uncharacterized protein LOC109707188 isoform X3 n=1 Tax=Ananas comosus TaxID=4615 RepID=A0A6P5EK31_ANACO|nr:uncharacterized protein LOC109707188 isoform X3 [Ananas comosus]